VLGITVSDPGPGNAAAQQPQRRLRLLAQKGRLGGDRDYCGGAAPPAGGCRVRSFVLQDGPDVAPDSVVVPGVPLVLTRGERTTITVVNRLAEPTTVHWHGMELESVFDGVAGWSRTGDRIAPLIAPGDSFTVHMTPPRAGTFIYHTHMDETSQLVMGMFGPLLVLEPGSTHDPEADRVFIFGGQAEGGYPFTLNGRRAPARATFRSGTTYRLRFINIARGGVLDVVLSDGRIPLRWKRLAKDGAELPPALQIEGPARIRFDAGETYDVTWTPGRAGDYTLDVAHTEGSVVRQTFRVR
jgi:manganese oxidase